MFWVALVVRVAAIFAFQSPARVDEGAWEFGFEAACIARSLHEGEGFAGQWTRIESPWNQGSGTTGWLGPIYPGLVAGAFALGGGLTHTAAWILFLVQSVVSALTCVFLARLGAEWGVARAGRIAAWILAFLPASIWSAAGIVWDTTLVAFGTVLAFWAVGAQARASTARAALVGVAFGILLLVNAAPVVFVPVLAGIAWHRRDTNAAYLKRALAFAACALVVTLPWALRNQREFGVLALRTNLGVELAVGNNDDANGRFQLQLHPSNGGPEFQEYRRLGEAEYARRSMERARAWIAEHPRRFLELCLLRVTYFWSGVSPWVDERVDNAGHRAASDLASWVKYVTFLALGVVGIVGALAWGARAFEGRALLVAFALFPLVYYATHALERYRHPIEPLLVLCAAVLFERLRARRHGCSLSSPG